MLTSLQRLAWWGRWPVSVQAVMLQLAVAPMTWLIVWVMGSIGVPLSWWQVTVLQGAGAALFSRLVGLPVWWWWIQAGFWPLLLLALQWQLPVWVPALLFALILAIYGGGIGSRVPLFLTSRKTCSHLATVLPADAELRFLDVGAGLGGVLGYVQARRPGWHCEGIERAWLPWLIGKLRLWVGRSAAVWQHGDFNRLDWSNYDIVYAYLSPAPMAQIWRKVEAEMRPGSIFISNSFDIPGVTPDQVVETGDWNHARLLIWYR